MPTPKFAIVVDSREQDPLVFPSREIQTVREALDTGDYAIKINDQLSNVRIERKSCGDLFASFVGDNYRREKEKIQRARVCGYRYIIAIEGVCSEIRKGHQYFKGGAWHQVQKDGLTMVRQLMTIAAKYHVELAFCDDRFDMGFYVQECLLAYVRMYEKTKKVDI